MQWIEKVWDRSRNTNLPRFVLEQDKTILKKSENLINPSKSAIYFPEKYAWCSRDPYLIIVFYTYIGCCGQRVPIFKNILSPKDASAKRLTLEGVTQGEWRIPLLVIQNSEEHRIMYWIAATFKKRNVGCKIANNWSCSYMSWLWWHSRNAKVTWPILCISLQPALTFLAASVLSFFRNQFLVSTLSGGTRLNDLNTCVSLWAAEQFTTHVMYLISRFSCLIVKL